MREPAVSRTGAERPRIWGRRARTGAAGALTCLTLTVLVMGPLLLRRGYVLRGDMVFVPDQPWKSAYLGLDGSLPRAVPTDAFVWLLGTALAGDLVQKVLLVVTVVVAVSGVWRLLGDAAWPARVAAAVAFVWTPYTHDRLAIGHWSLLLSTALLPWVVLAAARVAGDGRHAWPGLLITLWGAALMSPSGGVCAAAVAVAVVAAGRGPWLLALGLSLTANLPWLVPGVLADAAAPATRASVSGFAARAESPLGVLASLITSGGVWKQSIAAPERENALIVGASLVLVAVSVVGLRVARQQLGGAVTGLAVVAVSGLALCIMTATGPGADLMTRALELFPGTGLFRDTTRYLAPWSLLVAIGLGGACTWLYDRRGAARGIGLAVAVLAPILLLPSLLWGLLGRLDPVEYPQEWFAVRSLLADQQLEGSVVVLPWDGFYRRYAWNGNRAVLDPAPRFFPGTVLVDDSVRLNDATLPPEDPRVRAVSEALVLPEPTERLRLAGVGVVLVERRTPGAPTGSFEGRLLHRGAELEVWDLGTPVRSDAVQEPRAVLIMVADTVWVFMFAGGVVLLLVGSLAYTPNRRRGSSS
jgi:hypothetical protein